MPRAAGRPAGPARSPWDPQQSHVAEETGQRENSLSARSRLAELLGKFPPKRTSSAIRGMKRYWIIAPVVLIAAALFFLHRGVFTGVKFTITDANGPLPHHTIMTCRYQFITGIYEIPARPSVTVDPRLPNVGECPLLAH